MGDRKDRQAGLSAHRWAAHLRICASDIVADFPRDEIPRKPIVQIRPLNYREQLKAIRAGTVCRRLLAFDENGCEAQEVLLGARHLGADPEDAGGYVHQRAVRRLYR